jgi:hypothetical protein
MAFLQVRVLLYTRYWVRDWVVFFASAHAAEVSLLQIDVVHPVDVAWLWLHCRDWTCAIVLILGEIHVCVALFEIVFRVHVSLAFRTVDLSAHKVRLAPKRALVKVAIPL